MAFVYWLLSPYLLCWLAFLGADLVRLRANSNRAPLDLTLALVGFGLLVAGALGSIVRLAWFPYRSATTWHWLGFASRFAALILSLLLASDWLGSHIA